MRYDTLRRILGVLGFLVALAVWGTFIDRAAGDWTRFAGSPQALEVILAATLLPLPVIFLGRWALDRKPTAERANWVSTFVHYGVAIPLGVAIIAALAAVTNWPCDLHGRLGGLPCPAWPSGVGAVLVLVTGAAGVLTVVILALRGLGAPFAIALTQRLATDRLYGWTRNPMVLAFLALLVSIGIWRGSWWFIGWAVLVVTPVMLTFLKVYEERELEIRFGEPYLAYKRKTPMLIPRRPRPE